MSNITFTMIKPDATRKGYTGHIINEFIAAGFAIKAMKWTRLSKEQATAFYLIHQDQSFFQELITFMSSGNIVAAVLEKNNAVLDFRKLIGATNPEKAAANTIRKKYAASIGENAVHGSDSDANATIEANFFFSHIERL